MDTIEKVLSGHHERGIGNVPVKVFTCEYKRYIGIKLVDRNGINSEFDGRRVCDIWKRVIRLLFFISILLYSTWAFAITPIESLAKRIVPAYAPRIVFQKADVQNNTDIFTLQSKSGKLVISGNNYNSMAVGLNYYLKYYCQVHVSWYKDDVIVLPSTMPLVEEKVSKTARVPNRFFLNYCTYAYSMPWWRWSDWEHLIDWMALNGVTMPLSITGQEAIWYKVWKKFGLTDQQVCSYFTGPAYLPFHRMANIEKWDGPLPHSWLEDQLKLQKKIVKRERELGMTPILPAFAGHIPSEIQVMYPNAKVTKLDAWGGFNKQYASHFLDPFDPLFEKIQKEFLEAQTKEFGTNHIYGADPFNELTPPSWEPSYLASAADVIFKSMQKVDPKAEWLQMAWVFFYMRDKWTNERIKAFLRAVPQDKMTLLDYYCEQTEIWKLTESHFGQPYIWCYLGNFGGNCLLIGNLKEVENRMENALNNGGKNLTGIGSTLEGFDVNPVMYDYVFEKAWSEGKTDMAGWTDRWADRRLGRTDEKYRDAWQTLVNKIYTQPTEAGLGILINAKPALKGLAHWAPNPKITYNNKDLLNVWSTMINVANAHSKSYNSDIANVGWQVLGNHFGVLRDKFTSAYERRNIEEMQRYKKQLMTLISDIDRLLATQPSMLLGKWLEDARAIGKTEAEKDYYEKDARMIITVWGGETRFLNDYASRSWAGLTKDFYGKRWEMFFDEIIDCARNNKDFDGKAFTQKISDFEDWWVAQTNKFSATPTGNTYNICKELFDKYARQIQSD